MDSINRIIYKLLYKGVKNINDFVNNDSIELYKKNNI